MDKKFIIIDHSFLESLAINFIKNKCLSFFVSLLAHSSVEKPS